MLHCIKQQKKDRVPWLPIDSKLRRESMVSIALKKANTKQKILYGQSRRQTAFRNLLCNNSHLFSHFSNMDLSEDIKLFLKTVQNFLKLKLQILDTIMNSLTLQDLVQKNINYMK